MSVAGKPGYKETAVGWIPQEWRFTSFGAVADFRGGNAFQEQYQGKTHGEFPFIKVSDFSLPSNQIFIRGANHWIDSADNQIIKATLFEPGSVVFAKVGAALLLNRRRILLRKTALDNNLMAAIPRQIDSKYCYYLLQTIDFGKLVQDGAIPSINQGQLQSLPVVLPPLPDQQKIATILTAVDDKLDLIARQISATQTLKQGLMQTLFTRGAGTPDAQGRWHPHTEFQDSPIGQIPRSWEARKLEELATENITYGVVQPGEISAGGVPLVRGGDIKNGKIAANLRTVSQEISVQFKRTVLQGGELLISLVGYPGETAVVPEEFAGANIARQAGMVRTSSLAMSKFIHCYLASPTGRACLLGGMIGSAQQVINLKSLREVYVPMPAEAERDQISAICEEVFNKLDALTTKQTHYQSLKRGLMQKLLTGQWRVQMPACGYNP